MSTPSRTRAYAEDTKVPASKTMADISDLLDKSGASEVATRRSPTSQSIGFLIGKKEVAIGLEFKPDTSQQEINRRWRVLYLTVKAKLVAVTEGVSTIEREFLADMVLPNGKTVGDMFIPQLKEYHTTGKFPLMLEAPRS